MQIKTIIHAQTTATLTPVDCHLLSRACEAALEGTFGDETETLHLETLGAALRAAAIAAHTQWEMNAQDLTRLRARLQSLGL